MLKPNATKVFQANTLNDAVASFIAKGGSIAKIEKPGAGAGLKRRVYLNGKGVYGVPKKVSNNV